MEQYLVNPVNPMTTLHHKAWNQRSWRSKKNGKFGPLAGKAKRRVVAVRKAAKGKGMPLGLKRYWAAKRKAHKVTKVRRTPRVSHKRISKAIVVTPRRNPMPLMLLNARRKSHKVRRFRRNPLMTGYAKDASTLLLASMSAVAGFTIGNIIMDKASAKITVLNQPMVKAATFVGLGVLTYVLLKKTKKVPQSVASMIAVGMMLPAATDLKDFIMSKISGVAAVPGTVAYAGQDMAAYVPGQMSAFVPQAQQPNMGDYGGKY